MHIRGFFLGVFFSFFLRFFLSFANFWTMGLGAGILCDPVGCLCDRAIVWALGSLGWRSLTTPSFPTLDTTHNTKGKISLEKQDIGEDF